MSAHFIRRLLDSSLFSVECELDITRKIAVANTRGILTVDSPSPRAAPRSGPPIICSDFPWGEGEPLAAVGLAKACSSIGRVGMCSLSPRERVRVRGNGL